jgi:2-dehydro-3-deoxyphosphogluconate aldolase/(4S)-4-hydroxy-2-oxoglutarate aldolase
MTSDSVFKQLCRIGIVPVIRSDRKQEAIAAVQALANGGIPVAEITMTVPSAIDVIENLVDQNIRQNVGNGDQLIIGAGTVTDANACAAAIAAGCRFIVTPIFAPDVIAICREKEVCVIGGALTPTEIHATFRAGAHAVKVFPAKALGGAAYFKMLREPFPHIPLVPTGGVDLETLPAYFEAGALLVGAGGDLVRRKALHSGDMEQITLRAKQYVAAIAGFRR